MVMVRILLQLQLQLLQLLFPILSLFLFVFFFFTVPFGCPPVTLQSQHRLVLLVLLISQWLLAVRRCLQSQSLLL